MKHFYGQKKYFHTKKNIFYVIERGEKKEEVSRETLLFFKKILGKDVLRYSEIFNEEQNRHLKV